MAFRWTPILGNCNQEFFFSPDTYVRCSAIVYHEGLHRCHFQPTAFQTSMLMWGDQNKDVSIDVLRDQSNPLCLIPTSRSVWERLRATLAR